MPVTRAGSVSSSRPPVEIRPGSSYRASNSLDQARQGSAFIKKGQAGDSVRQLQDMLSSAGIQKAPFFSSWLRARRPDRNPRRSWR